MSSLCPLSACPLQVQLALTNFCLQPSGPFSGKHKLEHQAPNL